VEAINGIGHRVESTRWPGRWRGRVLRVVAQQLNLS
jgi:hypothetical protein